MIQAATSVAVAITVIFNMTVETGTASQYSPGVMRQVVVNRQGMGQLSSPLPEVDGFIAVLS
jgi:hypothetical protein